MVKEKHVTNTLRNQTTNHTDRPHLMSPQTSLGTRIETLRKTKGLTQAELAAIVFVTPKEIDEIESGLINQPMYILDLADALDVTPEYLQFGDEAEISEPLVVKTDAEPSFTADYVAAKVHELWSELSVADQAGLWWVLAKLDSNIERRSQQSTPPGGVDRRK